MNTIARTNQNDQGAQCVELKGLASKDNLAYDSYMAPFIYLFEQHKVPTQNYYLFKLTYNHFLNRINRFISNIVRPTPV